MIRPNVRRHSTLSFADKLDIQSNSTLILLRTKSIAEIWRNVKPKGRRRSWFHVASDNCIFTGLPEGHISAPRLSNGSRHASIGFVYLSTHTLLIPPTFSSPIFPPLQSSSKRPPPPSSGVAHPPPEAAMPSPCTACNSLTRS